MSEEEAAPEYSSPYDRKRILIGAMALFLFLLGLALVMQGLIDTRNFREEITRIIQLQTKRKVVIRGNVSVSLLPTPTLYVPGVELRDAHNDGEPPSPTAMVEMIRIQVSLISLISQKPRITSISFDNPVLEVVRWEDNLIHWGWVNSSLLTAMSSQEADALRVDVNNGRIVYRESRTDNVVHIDNISLKGVNAGRFGLSGGFSTFGHAMSFNMDTEAVSADFANSEKPLNFSMTSDDGSSLQLKGSIGFKDELPIIKGHMDMDLKNTLDWMRARKDEKTSLLDMVTTKEASEGKYPLKMSGELTQHGLTGEWKDLRIEGMNSAGVGTITLTWRDWRPSIASDLQFSAIDYATWEYVISTGFVQTDADMMRQYRNSDESPSGPLPKNIMLRFNIKADEVYFGYQSWKNAVLSTTLGDGSITVNQFSIDLPGESSLTLFGVISPSATQDLRFEGSMETKGTSLRNMLTVLDPSAAELPEMGFGSFAANANIFISREQLRLSEADVKLSDLHLNGGLVFYFDAQPRVEADVRLKNINFDYFRDAWRERQSKNVDKGKDFFLKFDKNMNFNWLKKLATTIDFRVSVDRFVFMEHPGTTASFRIYARGGDFGIYDINFIYPNDIMRGTFRLNVTGEKPLFNLSLSAAEMNTNYFSYANNFMAEGEKRERMENRERELEEAIKKAEAEKALAAKKAKRAAERAENGEEGEDDEEETTATPTASAAGAKPLVAPNPEAPITLPNKPINPDAADGALRAIGAMPTATSNALGTTLEVKPQSNLQAAPAEEVMPPREATTVDDLLDMSRPRIDRVVGDGKLVELIDMSWMSGISGVLDLSFTKLVHKDLVLNNFRIQSNFSNDLLTFKTLTFNYWGGQVSIAGSMYGGKVPGFSISVAFLNGDFGEIMRVLTERENLSGGVSISATFATSGVNFLSWLQQLEGKVVLAVRGMTVRGFNLGGVGDAVNMSRTSSDVANSINRIITAGSTNFSLDGNINIKNGLLRTPGMNLRSETIAGSLTGEIRLMKWYMDLTSSFQFPEMSSDTVPTLTVQVKGPIDKADLRVDTSSLEAYVAKRIISK